MVHHFCPHCSHFFEADKSPDRCTLCKTPITIQEMELAEGDLPRGFDNLQQTEKYDNVKHIFQMETVKSKLHLFFSPRGRISRSEYWAYGITQFILIIILGCQLSRVSSSAADSFSAISLFIVLYCGVILQIKRLHDMDDSGWHILIVLIPVVGKIWLMVKCAFYRGNVGINRYGMPSRGFFPKKSKNTVARTTAITPTKR